jgi:hypothetical protein
MLARVMVADIWTHGQTLRILVFLFKICRSGCTQKTISIDSSQSNLVAKMVKIRQRKPLFMAWTMIGRFRVLNCWWRGRFLLGSMSQHEKFRAWLLQRGER